MAYYEKDTSGLLVAAAQAKAREAAAIQQRGQLYGNALTNSADVYNKNVATKNAQAQQGIVNQRAQDALVLQQEANQRAKDKIAQDNLIRQATNRAFKPAQTVQGDILSENAALKDYLAANPNVDNDITNAYKNALNANKAEGVVASRVDNITSNPDIDQNKLLTMQKNKLALQQATPGTEEYNALMASKAPAAKYGTQIFKTPDGFQYLEKGKAAPKGWYPYNKSSSGSKGSSKVGSQAYKTSYTKLRETMMDENLDSNFLGIDFLGSGDTKTAVNTLGMLEAIGVDPSEVSKAYDKMKLDSTDREFTLNDLDKYLPPVMGEDGKYLGLGKVLKQVQKDGRQPILIDGKLSYSKASKIGIDPLPGLITDGVNLKGATLNNELSNITVSGNTSTKAAKDKKYVQQQELETALKSNIAPSAPIPLAPSEVQSTGNMNQYGISNLGSTINQFSTPKKAFEAYMFGAGAFPASSGAAGVLENTIKLPSLVKGAQAANVSRAMQRADAKKTFDLVAAQRKRVANGIAGSGKKGDRLSTVGDKTTDIVNQERKSNIVANNVTRIDNDMALYETSLRNLRKKVKLTKEDKVIEKDLLDRLNNLETELNNIK